MKWIPTAAFVIPILCTLPGCSFFGWGNPSSEVAQRHMSGLLGKVWNTKVSNCSGDDSRKTCAVSYNRSFSQYQYYEEVSMDFQKTPSGWSVLRYKVIKTQNM